MPTTSSAVSAMMTVRPAKTTAEPAVPTAIPTASARSSVCCELAAIARQDEERVVDADREADHGGEHRSGGADVDEGGHRGDAHDAESDTDQGGEDRQAGRHDRAEGEEQDEQGDARCRSARTCRRSPSCRWSRSRWPRQSGRHRGCRPARPSRASIVAGSTSATESTAYSQEIVPTRPSSLSGDSAAALACAAATGVPASVAAWTRASSCAARPWTGPGQLASRASAASRRGP